MHYFKLQKLELKQLIDNMAIDIYTYIYIYTHTHLVLKKKLVKGHGHLVLRADSLLLLFFNLIMQ